MIAPRGNRMMRVPPTAAPGDGAANSHIELFRSEISEKVGVELADWRAVAHPQTAIDDLDGQFTVGGRTPVINPPNVFEILDEAL